MLRRCREIHVEMTDISFERDSTIRVDLEGSTFRVVGFSLEEYFYSDKAKDLNLKSIQTVHRTVRWHKEFWILDFPSTFRTDIATNFNCQGKSPAVAIRR